MSSKEIGLVPKLRFPEFSGDWLECSVEDLINKNILLAPKDGNHGNIHPKSSDYVKAGIPFIMASDLQNGQIDFTKCAYLRKEQADNLQKGFAKEGDVLLSHKGTVGEVVLLLMKQFVFTYVMLTPQVTYYRINDKSKLYNEYLAAFFISDFFQSKLKDVSGGGTRAYIGITEQRKLKIQMPIDIAEQQKIADCLSSLDELITMQTEKLKALKEHKKGLMQELFPAEGETVPKLRFPEFSGDWKIHNIIDLAKVTTGNKDTQNKIDDGKYPFFVRSQTVERINSFSLDCEAILTSGDGVGVGKNYHYINGKFDFHQRVYCIYDFTKNVNGKFIYNYFSEHFYKRVMRLSAKNSVDSVRMAMISEMPILTPEIEEQTEIAAFLSSLDELINLQSKKIGSLKEHKKGMMQQLFPSIDEIEE